MTSDKAAAIQRYTPGFIDDGESRYLGMREYTDGGYVKYTDHAAALQAARDEIESLKHEAEQKDQAIAKSYAREKLGERRVAALEECAFKYLAWLDVKNTRKALEQDLANPEMCGEHALAPAKKVD